jgi:hypothetical protein
MIVSPIHAAIAKLDRLKNAGLVQRRVTPMGDPHAVKQGRQNVLGTQRPIRTVVVIKAASRLAVIALCIIANSPFARSF